MIRDLLKSQVEKFGFDVRRTSSLGLFLRSRKIDLVIDVGANEGQFGCKIRNLGYRGEIISFEPVSSAFKVLEKRAKRDRFWRAENFALGEKEGNSEIYVSEYSVFSSLLPLTPLASTFDKRSAPIRTETIQVKTLQSY